MISKKHFAAFIPCEMKFNEGEKCKNQRKNSIFITCKHFIDSINTVREKTGPSDKNNHWMQMFLLWISLSYIQFKLQTANVFGFFLVSPTLMCYLWLRMTSDAHNSISQKLESQQKRMSRVNKNGKCSFVLERQHTNLHLFNDLFVSSESYLFARIHSLSLLRLSFLAFLSNHSPYHLFSFLSFSIVIDKWHLIYFIFVNFAFGFVLRGDEDFLHDFVAFQVFNAFKCSHRKIRRKWKIILII